MWCVQRWTDSGDPERGREAPPTLGTPPNRRTHGVPVSAVSPTGLTYRNGHYPGSAARVQTRKRVAQERQNGFDLEGMKSPNPNRNRRTGHRRPANPRTGLSRFGRPTGRPHRVSVIRRSGSTAAPVHRVEPRPFGENNGVKQNPHWYPGIHTFAMMGDAANWQHPACVRAYALCAVEGVA